MIRSVLDYLQIAYECHPQKTAVISEDGCMSYARLYETAAVIGFAVSKRVNKGEGVAVLMEKGSRALASFLGVAAAGGFYAPVDPSLPPQRIESMLKTLNTRLIITESGKAPVLEGLDYSGDVLLYEDIAQGSNRDATLGVIRQSLLPRDPLYCIFTSGSTGVPKGVLISHGSVISFIEEFTSVFSIDETDVIGNQAPFDFDVSVKDIYSALKCAATLCIIPKVHFSFPTNLIKYLNDNGVTTIIWAVSAMSIVANFKAFTAGVPQYLKRVMFSGEIMPMKHLKLWQSHLPNAEFVNLYGPTEITCNCTYYIVDREFADTDTLPIGRPFNNCEILLLDGDKSAAEGESGEICVRGCSLAFGYYNNAERTAEAFVQNPLNTAYSDIIYRTGDLGRYNANGELVFQTRKDFQIKHMGHRIEPGEIEAAVNAVEGIFSGACVFDAARNRIVYYFKGEGVDQKKILAEIGKSLPKYMWPNKFIELAAMPMTKNGKINRVLLKEMLDDEENK